MSMIDWNIHCNILHSEYLEKFELRKMHKRHHIETKLHQNHVSKTGLYFGYDDVFYIVAICSPFVLYIAQILEINVYIAMSIHVGMVYIFIGAHNNCHESYHSGKHQPYEFPYIYVPNSIKQMINYHHAKHHEDPKTNFCNIVLGFDYVMRTHSTK